MLPKAAGQLLHHTSRAVAAAQSQTGHTIRNVLQSGPTNLGQWNGPSSSSSGWNGSGPSSGGAKFHSSSRFHSSYTGAGRAVTQGDASTSYNDHQDNTDEGFELVPAKQLPVSARSKRRTRSHSLTFTLQEQQETTSVLKAVQHHVRARHAFAVSQQPASGTDSSPPPPLLESSQAQSIQEATADESPFSALNTACRLGDLDAIQREVAALRSSQQPSPATYNAILLALRQFRSPGTPLTQIMEVYNEMLSRSLHPNTRTYCVLILALTDRDHEVHKSIRVSRSMIHRREALGIPLEPAHLTSENESITRLQAENNFGSAITLFQAIGSSLGHSPRAHQVYRALLKSCALHSNVDAAIHIFSLIEGQRGIKISPFLFEELIAVYISAGDLAGAEEVFEEYKKWAHLGRIITPSADSGSGALQKSTQRSHIAVWNKMILAYLQLGQPDNGLKLLEQMMDSSPGPGFGVTDIPPPSAATFTSIIDGFCHAGDVTSALTWFDRLSKQTDSPGHPLGATVNPTKPEPTAWYRIINALCLAGMTDDLNRLLRLAKVEGINFPREVRVDAAQASLRHLNTHPDIPRDDALLQLNTLVREWTEDRLLWTSEAAPIHSVLVQTYLRLGDVDSALDIAESSIRAALVAAAQSTDHIEGLHTVQQLSEIFSQTGVSTLDLRQMLRLGMLFSLTRVHPQPPLAEDYLRAYGQARHGSNIVELSAKEWGLIFHATLSAEQDVSTYANGNVVSLTSVLEDFSQTVYSFAAFDIDLQQGIVNGLIRLHGVDNAKSLLMSLPGGDNTLPLFGHVSPVSSATHVASSPARTSSPTSPRSPATPKVRVDAGHSKTVDGYCSPRAETSPLDGYEHFEAGLINGVYPNPEVLGRLISALGRLGEVDKVRTLYDAAQTVLATMEHDRSRQSFAWFQVEDQMIVALAHAGDGEAAHIHRNRILAQGGTPSADAYAALIQRVKATTDDTANAMTLFEEARSRGVAPNVFLYNTAISKLAKARKVDHALALFEEMRAAGFKPTSVTYGAVIAACCRVGDTQSAEILFQEMASQPNFKPRVPPFNTMMQLYTHTKPDRERVLFYHGALKRAKVQPTAHTYKLLMDAYGTIEPVDLQAMEDTFKSLEADKRVSVHGTHWAALINAHGCVKKDLDKAIAVFDSIAKHRASAKSKLPDAICFEALLNVLVTLKRADLIPQYLGRLSASGVHMTAYIANLVIKGYAITGDIERARVTFEGLIDPPEGIAAPGNHAVYDFTPPEVSANAPVYREPSTWETMIRAELGNGNRDRALALLERLQARRFPPAVYHRISGILSTDSISIWDSQDSPQYSPQFD